MSSLQCCRGYRLLRCPLCRLELTVTAGALVCRNRHSFDRAREGYVNLLSGGRRRPAAGGDGSAQLRHRAAFLGAGHFDAIAATIAEHVLEASAKLPFREWCILDAGFGTGHHLAKLAVALPPPVIGLGLDIAKDAARRAARHWLTLAFAVADLWAEWPVRDAAIDLVISIFAPKNLPEAARVLRPGGWLALVYPGPEHLIELRDRFGLIAQHEDKTRRYSELARRYVGPPTIYQLSSRAIINGTAIRAAILMGPNARHIALPILDPEPEPSAVTFDLTLLLARKISLSG